MSTSITEGRSKRRIVKEVTTAVSKGIRRYGKKDLVKDLDIAAGYTVVIVTLIQLSILRLPGEYLPCAL
jgi:hypothetical protein